MCVPTFGLALEIELNRIQRCRHEPDDRVEPPLCLLVVAYVWTMIEIANVCHRAGLPVVQCLGRG